VLPRSLINGCVVEAVGGGHPASHHWRSLHSWRRGPRRASCDPGRSAARSGSWSPSGWPNSGHASLRHSQSCSGPPSALLAGW